MNFLKAIATNLYWSPRKLIDPILIQYIDVLASKFKYWEACECWALLPEVLGELSVLMKYDQISMVFYLNEREELCEAKYGCSY